MALSVRRLLNKLALVAVISASPAFAASYLPLSDADLARRAPVIVRARSASESGR
jgi:hypothetical protein